MLMLGEVGGSEIAVFDGVDEMIEDLAEGAFRNAHELCKFLVFKARKTFSDIPGARASRIPELIAELEVGCDFGFRDQLISECPNVA